MNCGALCIKYLFDNNEICDEVNSNIFWISEIALDLSKYFEVKLYYYDSNLMRDYLKGKKDLEAFNLLDKVKFENIFLCEKKLNKEVFLEELVESQAIILLVSSALLNNNAFMEGGHFLLIIKTDKGYKVLNPQKDKLVELNVDISDILYWSNVFGSWRLLIGGKR